MANYYIVFYKIGISYMGSKTTPYAFTKEEMDRCNPSLWAPSIWLAFYRDNWYYFTAAAFVISTLMALFVHQVEEYILPGGGPLVNVAFYGERKDYDRYPGNKLSMAWVNTLAYPFYISAVVFSDQIWLGLAQCIFGFFQVIGQGRVMNIKANTAYNPGVVNALLLHLPIGVYYIAFVQDHQLIKAVDWIYGLGAFILASLVTIALLILSCRDRQFPYPLTAREMAGFDLLNKYRAKGLLKVD
ncbi:hypothetical protein LQW54_002073 [Pestalotiopsis sp. IQ-011]